MSFAVGGQGTEAQPRHRHCQGTLGTRQSKPRETASVERKPSVAVAARKPTLSEKVMLLWLDYCGKLHVCKACAVLCKEEHSWELGDWLSWESTCFASLRI